jgi:hypothetical protein
MGRVNRRDISSTSTRLLVRIAVPILAASLILYVKEYIRPTTPRNMLFLHVIGCHAHISQTLMAWPKGTLAYSTALDQPPPLYQVFNSKHNHIRCADISGVSCLYSSNTVYTYFFRNFQLLSTVVQ